MNYYKTFTGTPAEYAKLHRWVKKVLGKPSICEQCKRTGLYGVEIHWANISGEYKQSINDWARLCAMCHHLWDFPAKQFCKRGHAIKGFNVYLHPTGGRMCRECKRLTRKEWRAKKREQETSSY